MKEGYKKTELGWIPEEWEVKKLNDIANIKRGASPRPIKDPKWFSDEKNVGWVRISDVTLSSKYLSTTTQYLSEEGVKKSRLVTKGDLIMSICATVGKPIIMNMNACIHDGFVLLDKIDEDIYSKIFMYYVLQKYEENFKSMGQTGTQANLNTELVGSLSISVPPLKEQQKIAEILSTVDAQIDDTDNLIEKTKELKKGLMQRLLTKGIGHSEFKKSEVGEIPVEWNVYELKEISERIIVGLATSVTNYYVDTGIPIIRNLNIRECKFDDSSMLFLDEKFANSQINKTVKKDDIITVHTGANLGLTCLVPDKYEGAHTFTTLITTVNKKLVDPMYIMFHINSEYGRKEIERLQVGGGKSNLNVKEFALYKIALPKKIEEQRQISGILSSVDKEIEGYKIKKLKLEELKKGLMQQLLTGKIRVV